MRRLVRLIVSHRPSCDGYVGWAGRPGLVLLSLVLPACGPITGPSGNDGLSDECRSQCELAAGQCDEQPMESFPSFSEQLDLWRGEAESQSCQGVSRYAAQCSNGRNVLVEDFVQVQYYSFYEGSTDVFLGLRTRTDTNRYPPCNSVGYWPEWISCDDPVVTEVLCEGGDYDVGDALDLPRAGRP